MLRYTDVGWMDDNTTPSVKVRHNIQGLSLIFPPAYLLSFLANLGWEPLHNSPDLPMYVRSRMQGVMGLSFQSAWLSDDDRDVIAEHVTLYKNLRPTLTDATAVLLTPQATRDGEPEWDVLQESADGGAVLLYAFDSGAGPDSTIVLPLNLEPGVSYRVVSVDSGALGELKGADLMESGIRIIRSPRSAAHVLSLVPQR